MDTKTIFSSLKANKKTKKCIYGVYPIDKLPKKFKLFKSNEKEKYLVVNTDPSYKPGKHWFALCISKNGKKNEYFDSYGVLPNKKIQKYLNNNFIFVNITLQSKFTTSCGQWCMYYILHKCLGGTLRSLVKELKFLKKPYEKDIYINKIVQSEFKKRIKLIDWSFLTHQLAQQK